MTKPSENKPAVHLACYVTAEFGAKVCDYAIVRLTEDSLEELLLCMHMFRVSHPSGLNLHSMTFNRPSGEMSPTPMQPTDAEEDMRGDRFYVLSPAAVQRASSVMAPASPSRVSFYMVRDTIAATWRRDHYCADLFTVPFQTAYLRTLLLRLRNGPPFQPDEEFTFPQLGAG